MGGGGSFCQVFTLSKKYEGQGSTLHLEFLAKERGPRPPTEEAAGSNCPRPRHSHELLPNFLSHGQAVPADPACPPTPTQRGASRPQDPSRLIADVGKESSHESLQDARQTQDVPAEPAQHRGLRLQAHPRLPGPTRPPGHSFWADPGTFPSVILKSRDIVNKGPSVKAMFFPVVMYRCESWAIKKAENQRIGAFDLWCWSRLLRFPWTARRSNQSILKEIIPEYSLQELMLKLKLQYFGHLM